MANHIKSLEISGFRTLSELVVGEFGRVNLITGKNNAGKSSVLEAIRILTSSGSSRTLFDILKYREEITVAERGGKTFADLGPVTNLFTGFPSEISEETQFSIGALGEFPPQIGRVNARLGWFIRQHEGDGVYYREAQPDLFPDSEAFPALSLDLRTRKRVIPLDRLQSRTPVRLEDAPPFPCIYIDPFSSRSTSELGALWDAIALTDVESELVRALQIVSADIQAVSVIGGEDRYGRTAIAKSSHFERPVPLRTFGDGVNRVFGITLSLCSAKGGILLIDEIENGLHFTTQTELWRTIFRLAGALDVQVFATSHSWDCVRAFQEAASESPYDGVLVRLSRVGEQIVPTTFSERELEIATRDQIEVR